LHAVSQLARQVVQIRSEDVHAQARLSAGVSGVPERYRSDPRHWSAASLSSQLSGDHQQDPERRRAACQWSRNPLPPLSRTPSPPRSRKGRRSIAQAQLDFAYSWGGWDCGKQSAVGSKM